MDEPCSALDPIATMKIEELLQNLRSELTIVIVTHNMQQASRLSDYTAFFSTDESRIGQLVEFGPTPKIFTGGTQPRTRDYVEGRLWLEVVCLSVFNQVLLKSWHDFGRRDKHNGSEAEDVTPTLHSPQSVLWERCKEM